MDEEFNRINCSAVIRCRTTQRSGWFYLLKYNI